MKTASGLCLLIVGCGGGDQTIKPDQIPQVQTAIDEVSQAIVNRDLTLFKSRFLPDAYHAMGATDGERDKNTAFFMDSQRVGLIAHYGVMPPKAVDVENGFDGDLSVSISVDGSREKVGPKRLNLWRDVADGRIYFAGIQPAKTPPSELAAAGINKVPYSWDCSNASSTPHSMLTSWDTPASMASVCLGCGGTPAICQNVQGIFFPGNGSGSFTIDSNNSNLSFVVSLVSVGDNHSCACDGTSSCFSTVNSCCWVNPWGWDFWWNSTDHNSNSLPFCSTNTCGS